ncbi:protein PNS1-like isoform X2 [Populus alba x Populus x berolinensis]|nr:protein PNS1-like isoform X2 [Populus alba x Populus x berolinensis]
MGAAEPVVERESERREEGEKEEEGNERKEEGGDVEKGEVLGVQGKVIDSSNFDVNNDLNNQFGGSHVAMMQRLNPTNPLRIVIGGSSGMPTPSPSQTSLPRSAPIPQTSLPRSAPIPQPSQTTLNSRRYTNKISLFLFVFHMVAAVGLVSFLIFKGIQGLIEASESVKRKERRILKFYLPQVETASLLSITLAFVWQKAVRQWPRIMVPFILWCSFFLSLSAGILLICFQRASTDGVGVCLIAFAIGNGLYACWVTQRIGFCTEILIKSLEPVPKFGDLNQPTYWMLGVGFMWMSLWILAVIGAMNFHFTPLVIIVLVLSLAWTAEVMRNIVNLTVSRVIALYYLRGMQSIPQNCFQRAFTQNLGSACLGSLFVPTIEALRVVVRGLNLLEGEDEFMFSCAHCCLNVMQSIFRYGNGWAFVQVISLSKLHPNKFTYRLLGFL